MEKNNHLQELDLVFSRDQIPVRYVQHVLSEKSQQLICWVKEGAAIYVCGSLQGMAQGVDEALPLILDAESMEDLADRGRYCRDVY